MKKQALFDVWIGSKGSKQAKCVAVQNHVLSSINPLSEEDQYKINEQVRVFCWKLSSMWEKCKRMKSRFLNAYGAFLSEEITLKSVSQSSTSKGAGRPSKSFVDISDRSKRRRVQNTLSMSEEELSYATGLKLRKSGKRTVANLVKEVLSPTVKETHRKRTSFKSTAYSSAPLLSEQQALSLITEADLSKQQYLTIRNMLRTLNINVLPSYQKIVAAKKKCYPSKEGIIITESSAEVKLQNLLDHTASRIIDSQEDVLNRFNNEELSSLILISKWGFDGSTGHSEYSQKSDNEYSDQDLFVSSMVPLQLFAEKADNRGTKILWHNSRPASTRYCRPIRFQFQKENVNISIEEERHIQSQYSALEPTRLNFCGREIVITHTMSLTMVDGKVCNALTSTSSAQVCYVCGVSPKGMNDIDAVLTRSVNTERFRFGLSTLHAWIRFLEYFLHLAYRLDFKKWQARGTNTVAMKTRKSLLQERFRREMGLIVDKVKPGGAGTTNNGNTARRFFANPALSSSITGIEESLIWRCSVILRTISSNYKINLEEFDIFAVETARQLVHRYPWFYLPASIHKILIHGSQIIEKALLPIGQLSEEASESRNKDLKKYRETRTRKISRKVTNEDLLNRLLLTSDPLITSLRILPERRAYALPTEVLRLLKAPEVNTPLSSVDSNIQE